MDKIEIVPMKSFNGIFFGTKREELRKEFAIEFLEFKKSKYSENTTDDYKLFHIFYDKSSNFEAIETFGDIPVFVGDIDLFSMKITDLPRLADDFVEEYGSYISKSKSMGITFENGNVESALFGSPNYYG